MTGFRHWASACSIPLQREVTKSSDALIAQRFAKTPRHDRPWRARLPHEAQAEVVVLPAPPPVAVGVAIDGGEGRRGDQQHSAAEARHRERKIVLGRLSGEVSEAMDPTTRMCTKAGSRVYRLKVHLPGIACTHVRSRDKQPNASRLQDESAIYHELPFFLCWFHVCHVKWSSQQCAVGTGLAIMAGNAGAVGSITGRPA